LKRTLCAPFDSPRRRIVPTRLPRRLITIFTLDLSDSLNRNAVAPRRTRKRRCVMPSFRTTGLVVSGPGPGPPPGGLGGV
jgi:hypothetical protein